MASAQQPEIWALLGDKLGDNAQVQAILDSLGRPIEVKYLRMLEQWEFGKPRFTVSLDHIDRQASDKLEPPWPKVIITIGRRLSQAALWIKEQSGNKTKVALVGRPKRWPEKFDLVIGLPQYDLPDAPNVVQLNLPLMRPDMAKVEAAAEAWRGRLADMPRPLTAVMVGGQTQPFRFDADAAYGLASGLNDYLKADGGSLYLSTSRRTGQAVSRTLKRHVGQPSRIFDWNEDRSEDNPYHALLGLADRFIVTTDSVSMIVEAVRMRKPLSIYPLPVAKLGLARIATPLGGMIHSNRTFGYIARQFGATGFSRDLDAFRESIVASGLAVPFGEPFKAPAQMPEDDLQKAVSEVNALVGA